MKTNVAGQKFHIVAFNNDGRVTGEAANITCTLAIDGGSRNPTNDVNPTEIGTTGEYVFDLTQAETNGHALSLAPVCDTAEVQVLGMPSNVIYTTTVFPLVGPFIRTVTVTDSVSGNPIENATVRLSQASDSESKTTNVSGVATFTVAAVSWSYSIFNSGYAGTSGTIAVSANGDTPVAMVALAPATPAEAPRTNVLLPTEDQYGSRRANVTVKFTFLSHAAGATITGTIVNTPGPKTSDSDGICRVTLRRLANYKAEYTIPGDRTPKTVLFTTGNTGTDTIIDD